MKKTTLATIKSFINKNRNQLFIDCKSTFDGMVDCVMPLNDRGFTKALEPDENRNFKGCLGIKGAYFVFGGGDYFSDYEDENYKGYEVYNCCGSFILAIQK